MNLIPEPDQMYADSLGVNEPDDVEEEDMEDLHMFAQKLRDNHILPYQFDLHMKKIHYEWITGCTGATLKGDIAWNPDSWILLNGELDKFIAETGEE